ncbi:MAG: beta-ketoacyl-ACP synthase II [Alphaproteobacteria bacterium]
MGVGTRRVVVTGLGAVSPLGSDLKTTWDNLIRGKSGISPISGFDASDLRSQIAGQIPRGPGGFDPDTWVSPKEQKKMGDFILYALAAAEEALADANWKPESEEDRERTGVIIGSGIGGLPGIYETSVVLKEQGPRRVSPFFIPSCLINLASGHVSIRYGFTGPNHAVVTACSTGAHAIGDASRLIMFGDADVILAGGTEASVCRIGVAGFAAAKALSTAFNDTPEKASRPWDKDRDGFVIGEGAGLMVLEELEHAKKRGARIYAEIIGYGLSGDAHHITAPSQDGMGAYRAMRNALRNAGIAPESVGYVNAHGTSTPPGDTVELKAVHRVFGAATKQMCMSSTKSSIGHLLGAAGGIEAIFSILAMRDNILPPTLNLDNCSEETDLDLIPHRAKEKKVDCVLSNSFGFGGTNASVIFKRFE